MVPWEHRDLISDKIRPGQEVNLEADRILAAVERKGSRRKPGHGPDSLPGSPFLERPDRGVVESLVVDRDLYRRLARRTVAKWILLSG